MCVCVCVDIKSKFKTTHETETYQSNYQDDRATQQEALKKRVILVQLPGCQLVA